ncbi:MULTISPECIES: PepSY-associated TM helix domain-containing protein [unclassified Moraxella]|uniref:PepSY-associated TM helix domain-containing protein n=1 Tax=unclassified Moraxella TaxID=2685852 RepID=UPI003AF58CAE
MTMKDFRIWMRIGHRYIGFFMAGIMLVYALSGVILVFRDTDLLKSEKTIITKVAPQLDEKKLAKELHLKFIEFGKREGDTAFFRDGQYNTVTGETVYTVKKLPMVLEKMNDFHKAPSKGSMGGLNIVFGVALLFFVLSSFFLFAPSSKIFKRGLAFVGVGAILSVVLLML